METPPPVNLSLLSGILANSKKVMQKVESVSPIVLSETTQNDNKYKVQEEIEFDPTPRAAGGYTKEQVLNSKMPPAVKEMMLKNIPDTLEDFSELEDVRMIPNKRSPITKSPIITENKIVGKSNSDLITISRSELKSIINESIVSFLTESYNKKIVELSKLNTEETIKKTINLLIKEGKINVKKKTI